MSSDYIKRYRLEVEIQDNGLIRDPFGWIIGCCHDEWFNAVVRHELPEKPERTCKPIIKDNMNETEGAGDAWANCGNCGRLLRVITDGEELPNYCPNCGARVEP